MVSDVQFGETFHRTQFPYIFVIYANIMIFKYFRPKIWCKISRF
jgi:hypothetical protein